MSAATAVAADEQDTASASTGEEPLDGSTSEEGATTVYGPESTTDDATD